VAESAALLTAEEEVRLARQARAGDLASRDTLASRNHRLVFDLANVLAWRLPPGMERADLIQEGFLGLYQAAERYDPERGFRFSTYATGCVRSHMMRAMRLWRCAIWVPEYQEATWLRLLALQERAAAEGREPGLAELAAAAGCTLPRARAMLALATPPLRLDQLWEGEDGPRDDYREPPCPRAPSEAAIVARMQVEAAVARLPARWQTYIRLRFGLDGGEPYARSEAAQALGYHRSSAGKLERAALERLKQLMEPRRPRRRR
jgi:RNA polymerase sigma factor (sigma-70 family)